MEILLYAIGFALTLIVSVVYAGRHYEKSNTDPELELALASVAILALSLAWPISFPTALVAWSIVKISELSKGKEK